MCHIVFCIVDSFDAPLGKHGSYCVLYCSKYEAWVILCFVL
jgi:hypothetical protein